VESETITREILRAHAAGEELSYTAMTQNNLPLLRAAARSFGGWRAAVEAAGLDYEALRRYERGRTSGSSPDPRTVETGVPICRGDTFRSMAIRGLRRRPRKRTTSGSWRAALAAAGLDYDRIRRYRHWSREGVIRAICERHARGLSLNAKTMEREQNALITAARRRFPSWGYALSAAGLDYRPPVRRRLPVLGAARVL
jgi:hypothetical protein